MTVLLGIICGAVVAAFATWILMDNANDRRWNREHGIGEDPPRGVSISEDTDEHLVTLRILWSGDGAEGLEVINLGIESIMTQLLNKIAVVDPSIEQTTKVRRT